MEEYNENNVEKKISPIVFNYFEEMIVNIKQVPDQKILNNVAENFEKHLNILGKIGCNCTELNKAIFHNKKIEQYSELDDILEDSGSYEEANVNVMKLRAEFNRITEGCLTINDQILMGYPLPAMIKAIEAARGMAFFEWMRWRKIANRETIIKNMKFDYDHMLYYVILDRIIKKEEAKCFIAYLWACHEKGDVNQHFIAEGALKILKYALSPLDQVAHTL